MLFLCSQGRYQEGRAKHLLVGIASIASVNGGSSTWSAQGVLITPARAARELEIILSPAM